ncbi:hypothetical protein ALI144C_05930 [Actinosynnema sp. ALI-1.44]|uniref:MerR family transcriptional regulator n=1 Tax=Actinosynnema sp. ALI-1.44 TaxID=1933779 RepID=UPI00097C7ACA|nr:MerR family transcriptional regulator [Actinosynnema sp. ALI-1.44]ONI89031.1 hypothetical protein ALI144C_05930 [Actinosynnema sp. ALI-1.44]
MDRTSSPAPAGQELTWSAGAVARMLDVPASTLRGWHRRYRIPIGDTPAGRHRRYTGADVTALLRMKHLIDQGVSAQSAAHAAFRPMPGAGVEDLLAAVSRLDTDTAGALLAADIAAHGVGHAWHTLCCPALNFLGGPEADDIDRCVDLVHVLSDTITTALRRVPMPPVRGPLVLLACVEGEHHTLPLEAVRAALAAERVPARLLGASLPNSALVDAMARTTPPPAVLVLWAHRPSDPDIVSTLTTPDTRLVLTGPGWPTPHTRSLPETVTLITRHTAASSASP